MYSLHSLNPNFSPFSLSLPFIPLSLLVILPLALLRFRASSWGHSWRGPEVVVLFVHSAGWICGLSTVIRHFGPSPKSCCFPNAKHNPPKRGGQWLHAPSLKDSTASQNILVDALRAKVGVVEILRNSVKVLWAEIWLCYLDKWWTCSLSQTGGVVCFWALDWVLWDGFSGTVLLAVMNLKRSLWVSVFHLSQYECDLWLRSLTFNHDGR